MLGALSNLAFMGGFGEPIMPRFTPHSPGEAPSRAYPKGSEYYEPNGNREVARRLRQIRSGQLKVSA